MCVIVIVIIINQKLTDPGNCYWKLSQRLLYFMIKLFLSASISEVDTVYICRVLSIPSDPFQELPLYLPAPLKLSWGLIDFFRCQASLKVFFIDPRF